jgi:hypothetical protein
MSKRSKTKLWWNGPWMAPFQNCVRWSRLPTKMATKLKIEKRGDEILIVHCCFSISQNELKRSWLKCEKLTDGLKDGRTTDDRRRTLSGDDSSPDPLLKINPIFMVCRPSSVRPSVRPLTFHILINSSEATGPIWTKLWWNGPWMAPFQNCVRWSRLQEDLNVIFYQNMPNLHNRYISAERKISQKNP